MKKTITAALSALSLSSILLVSAYTSSAVAAPASQAGTTKHTAVVKDIQDAGIYTYLQVDEGGETYWIAGPKTKVDIDATVTFSEEVWMSNFKSKAMNRTFDKVLFVSGIELANANTGMAKAPAAYKNNVPATLATANKDAGLLSIEDIYSGKAALQGQWVSVRGEVVKVSKNIMGRTWVHIKDGTGSGEESKVIFRSKTESANAGDTVTAKGVLNIDQDFGYGYFYSVIIEDSTFSK